MALGARLVSDRFPYLPIRLLFRGKDLEIESLVDTGFDGDIALPPELLAGIGLPDQHQRWVLADGTEVGAHGFFGTAEMAGFAQFPVLVTALGDEPLVGRGITDRFTITLDHGQRVVVES